MRNRFYKALRASSTGTDGQNNRKGLRSIRVEGG